MRSEGLQMLKLKIPGNIFEQMVEQAKAESPIEACGILAGKNRTVEKLYKMTNTDQSGDHFMMTPEEQFKVVKDIRSDSLEMLAIYHSHPETPARPSAEDIRLALTPDVIYVIVSLQNPEPAIKGFLIEDNSVTEVPVKIKVEQE
jgi:proteasome lid subunit RPN8/RPN11